MSDFTASPLSTELVRAENAGWSRSEAHAASFLLRYPNQRTRASYAVTLKQFIGWCIELGIEPLDATRNHIELFCRDLELHGRQNGTIASKLNALAGYFRYAQIDRLIDDNPMEHVTRPQVPRESTNLGLTRPEVSNICAKVVADYGYRDQAIILLLAGNGVRVSELVGLDVEHLFKFQGQPIARILRKGGKHQDIPLHPKVAWAIEQTIDGREAGPVFTTRTGGRIDRRVVGRLITRLCAEVGITKRVTPHSFRHAYVTLSLEAGRSERDVAASVGHADTRLVSYYDRGRDRLERNTTYSVMALIDGVS